MDAHLFRRFAGELLPVLQGARLVKIQQPHENIYTFNLDLFARDNPLGRKVQLILRPGRKEPFLFLSTARIAAGREPSAMVMRLRKYAAGHTIRRATALWQKRELYLLLSGATQRTAHASRKCAKGRAMASLYRPIYGSWKDHGTFHP